MKILLSIVLTFYIFTSCDCSDVDQMSIAESMVPDSVNITDTVKVSIKAEAYNGCWGDLHVKLFHNDDFRYSIKAYAKKSCYSFACPAVMVQLDTTLKIVPSKKGLYFVQVWESPNRYSIDSLIVK